MVDEVDLHLHPEWQQRVIPVVARSLPRLQFIFSSHSPLVVGTLWRPNVFVLTTTEEEGVRTCTIAHPEEEVYGLSADQILTSGAFGLASARNEQFVAELQQRSEAAKAGDPDAAMQFLRMMALGGAAADSPESHVSRETPQKTR
jgi:hypothetical protein